MKRLALAMFAATALAGCATAPMAMAQPPIMEPHMMPPASAIQPETTINLTGIGKVDHAPDTAMISVGVQIEAKTAADAMQQQATAMNGVFAAVKAAGIADRDMQTGNLSLNPVYEYPNNARPRLTGYQASNQLMIAELGAQPGLGLVAPAHADDADAHAGHRGRGDADSCG